MIKRRKLISASLQASALAGLGQTGPEIWPYVPVSRFGAVGDGMTDDTAAIQRAIDFVAKSHGTIAFHPGKFVLRERPGAITLEIPTGVDFKGAGMSATILQPVGKFTDSVVRSSTRDDKNPNTFSVISWEDLSIVSLSDSGVALLDCTGLRNSMFQRVGLGGNPAVVDQTAILISDLNPDGTSPKTCFFNTFVHMNSWMGGVYTWIKIRNRGNNIGLGAFINHQAYCQHCIDLADSTSSSFGSSYNIGYFLCAGKAEFVKASTHGVGMPGGAVFVGWAGEGFSTYPDISVGTLAYSSYYNDVVSIGSEYNGGHLQMGAKYHVWMDDGIQAPRFKPARPNSANDGLVVRAGGLLPGAGPVLPAAGSLEVTNQVHHVQGPGQISHITALGPIADGEQLVLIFDGPASLVPGDNIQTYYTAGPRGSKQILVWSAANATWY